MERKKELCFILAFCFLVIISIPSVRNKEVVEFKPGYNQTELAESFEPKNIDWNAVETAASAAYAELETPVEEEVVEEPVERSYVYTGEQLNPYNGRVPTVDGLGTETYYNLDMSGVIFIMRTMGFDEENYPYWVRDDGCRMLGPYIMVAANLDIYPRGTVVITTLGEGLVCDIGGFASWNPYGFDIAVTW